MVRDEKDRSSSQRADGQALTVHTCLDGSTATITAQGETDFRTVGVLDEALHALPDHTGSVTVDMAGLRFMDSSGLHFLSRLDAYGQRHHTDVQPTNWDPQPNGLLNIATAGSHRSPEPRAPVQTSPAPTPVPLASRPPPEAAPGASAAPPSENDQLQEEIRQLHQALDSRATIDQARGMLMAIAQCPSDAAWTMLVEISQRSNTKLREVAAALTATAAGGPLPAHIQREISHALHGPQATSG